MAVYTRVPAEALAEFLCDYDVGTLVSVQGIAEGVENSNYRVDTTSGRFLLTLYEQRVDEDDLPYFLGLMNHLADRGQPVPRAIADRTGRTLQHLAGRPACLIAFLPGRSPAVPTPAQADAAGAALAALHLAGADFAPVRENMMGIGAQLAMSVRDDLDLDAVEPGLHDRVSAAITQIIAASDWDLPRGTIHADLFPDNVLMQGDRITGLIDFYFACTGEFAWDLAIMHSAWAFDSTGSRFDAGVGAAIIAGYEGVRPLTAAERRALPTLARSACLRFVLTRAWDWLHTPDGAMVDRKDPLAYLRRLDWYEAHPGVWT